MPRPTVSLAMATIASIVVLVGCQSEPVRPALINHPVFITLQQPGDADELITDCNDRLRTIPGVVAYYCGKPFDSGRSTVDASYHVGLYVGFESADDYSTYVKHEDHVWLLEKWRPRVQFIRVHDVLDAGRK